MQQQVVKCPNCGHSTGPGHSLCMNCGNDLPAAPAVKLPLYRCPRCETTHPPQIVKRLTTEGWIILILGIIFFGVFGLLALFFIKERRVCTICGATVSWARA